MCRSGIDARAPALSCARQLARVEELRGSWRELLPIEVFERAVAEPDDRQEIGLVGQAADGQCAEELVDVVPAARRVLVASGLGLGILMDLVDFGKAADGVFVGAEVG